MSKNTKTIQTVEARTIEAVQGIGMTLMALAAVAGMVDLPGHPEVRRALIGQPVLSFANVSSNDFENSIRREKEDTAPHFISYSETQRTPGRSGRI